MKSIQKKFKEIVAILEIIASKTRINLKYRLY